MRRHAASVVVEDRNKFETCAERFIDWCLKTIGPAEQVTTRGSGQIQLSPVEKSIPRTHATKALATPGN